MRWAQVKVTTSQEAAEAVSNQLFDLNTVGVELQDDHLASSSSVILVSYFPMDDLVGDRIRKLQQFLEQLPQWGLPAGPASVTLTAVKNTDWSQEWRSAFPPQRIGTRITVAPTWVEIPRKHADVVIRLNPGMAFGTGQHSTTRLSIILLEKAIKGNEILADIGTGSGILSITAAKLGARHIDAVDLDRTTLPIALKNLQINGVESFVRLLSGEGLKPLRCKYDLIIANIVTMVLLSIIPEIGQFLKPNGEVILSGIMTKETDQIEKALNARGLQPIDIVHDAEWVGIWAKLRDESKALHS